MNRKAIIEIILVPESLTEKAGYVASEIRKELSRDFFKIPWGYRIEKITIKDSD